MGISIVCPSCSMASVVPASYAGHPHDCLKCGATCTVPVPPAPPVGAPTFRPAARALRPGGPRGRLGRAAAGLGLSLGLLLSGGFGYVLGRAQADGGPGVGSDASGADAGAIKAARAYYLRYADDPGSVTFVEWGAVAPTDCTVRRDPCDAALMGTVRCRNALGALTVQHVLFYLAGGQVVDLFPERSDPAGFLSELARIFDVRTPDAGAKDWLRGITGKPPLRPGDLPDMTHR